MADRTPYSLQVSTFSSQHDDIEEWIDLFEKSIKLAYPTADEDARKTYCISWLPLELDSDARTIYRNVSAADWDDIKAELKKLLVNPEDKYNWLARRGTISWDGKESLHSLATRIQRAVDKFDPDNGNKEREYFIRFRWAMPLEYRKAIDMNCGDDRPTLCTIKEAKTIALRLQMANSEAIGTSAISTADKTVAFTGASMSDDRLKSIELLVQGMSVRMENVESKLDKQPKSDDGDRRQSSRDRDPRRHEGRRDSRGRDGDRGRDGNRFRNSRDSLDRRNDRRGDQYRGFDGEQYADQRRQSDSRSRRDSYDRRYTRGDSRDR